ncbi:MAG: hypothetical protein ABSG38_16125 [Spirochaetia bacterium]|jgi:hypothetical protein
MPEPNWLNPVPTKTDKELQRESEQAQREEARKQKQTVQEQREQGADE